MKYFYVKDGEVFIPEKINPELVKLANAIVKAAKLNFRLQLKSNALNNAIKGAKREHMLEIMQKCFEKNAKTYDNDMALTGACVGEVEDSFFDDKDNEFIVNQLRVLVDFAVINTVIEAGMMSVLGASCKKALGIPLDKIKFFTNQEVVLEAPEEEDEEE